MPANTFSPRMLAKGASVHLRPGKAAKGKSAKVDDHKNLARVETFSDGVFAVLITIMVLDLRAPAEIGIDSLFALWPKVLAYSLSYTNVAFYWVNHHKMLSYAKRINGELLWSNIVYLFALSFVPFVTSYLGEHRFSRDAMQLYLAFQLLTSFADFWMRLAIRRAGADKSASSQAFHVATRRKHVISWLSYIVGIVLCYVSPWLGFASLAASSIFWLLPGSKLDHVFLRLAER